MQILILVMEPFVGCVGPDLGSTLVIQRNPYTTGPFASSCGARTEVSPEAVWGDAGTKFLHPKMVMMSVYSFYSYFHTGH